MRQGREIDVRGLLSADASLVDTVDAIGRSALVLAICGGHDAVVTALLEAGPTLGLSEAVMVPDWGRAMALVTEDPARLEAWLPVGGTALYAAARAGSAGLYRLQSAGANPDGNPRGQTGVTPAYGAIECASATWPSACCSKTLRAPCNTPSVPFVSVDEWRPNCKPVPPASTPIIRTRR